jgi:Glycogen debranching enzyme, glucanotransferase domain
MSVTRRKIPGVPRCPRPRAVAKEIYRSFPTGRSEISRAFAGSPFQLTISTPDHFPKGVRANLVTTINWSRDGEWNKVPFTLKDDKTLTCSIVPERTGLFSFWTQFSIDDGQTWIHDPVPDAWVLVDPPQVDHLRMYTLIPNVSGTFTDWAAELERIKSLGFNAVHFLPLTTLDTSRSPYSARNLFDVDPSYADTKSTLGRLEQLEAVVERAKELGIRLCFDLVLNHVGTDSDLARQAPEWITPDTTSPDGLRRARYLSDQGWQPWNDLVLINYEHPSQRIRAAIWDYMQEYALFWGHYASETNGFVRFDNLHSSDKNFIEALTVRLRQAYPNLGIIAEYFTDSGTLLDTVPKWGLNLVLATPWDHRWVKQLRDYLKYIHSVSDHVRFFMPVTSHDSGTPTQEFGSGLATIPRYVAAALLGTGATGITQGVEWGQKEKINFIGAPNKLIQPGSPEICEMLVKVNEILATHPAFRRGDNYQFVDDGHHAVIAVFRKDDQPGKIGYLVLCNFDIMGEQNFEIDLSRVLNTTGPIRCIDLLEKQEITYPSAQVTFKLPACAARVLQF